MDTFELFDRESQVAKAGAKGLSDAVSQTWSNANKELSKGVVHASWDYLKDHWQDAAAGAAISLVNPKGIANVALTVWSLRDLGVSTFDAAAAAADSKVDINQASQTFRQSIKDQGSQFASSLPMLVAGSMVGRSGANAVFGKDMAAWDLASGKVKFADVKSNLLDLKDAVAPPAIKLVVTDLDGTVWPFSDFFGPGAREAVKVVADKLGKTPAQVAESIGQVMEEKRSHEYPWILEQSSLAKEYKGTSEEFEREVVKPYWDTIDLYRKKYLALFPEVPQVLDELAKRKVDVAALSDAPEYIAKRKFVETGLDGKIKRLYAIQTTIPQYAEVSDPHALIHGLTRLKDFWGSPSSLPDNSYIALPRHFEKPNSGGLERILKDFNVRPKEVLAVIGDSRVKDGGVAASKGIPFIWARYGARVPAEYDEVLASFKRPAESSGTEGTKVAKKYAPIAMEAASYSDLLKLLDSKPNYGQLSIDAARSLWVMPRAKSLLGYNLLPRDKSSN